MLGTTDSPSWSVGDPPTWQYMLSVILLKGLVLAGVHGVLRRTESPGDSASSHQQQRQVLKPVIQPQVRDRKASVLVRVPPHPLSYHRLDL